MKQFLALVLCFVMVVGLCACGSNGNPTDPQEMEIPVTADEELYQEVLRKADERRERIYSSATAIVHGEEFIAGETYNGTAYYISNSGNDSNDGLTPATAFATLAPFTTLQLNHGDAILFERGGLWRCQMVPYQLLETKGITYSTYGEGEKPKLYYSPESGVGEDKWELAYEDDAGKKIWAFHSEMSEVAAIVLNGEIPVIRDIAYWDGSQYYMAGEDYFHATDTVYTVEEHLADMRCFPALYYPQDAEDTGRIYVKRYGENGPELVKGTLYFRCDAGNPGELYDDIEFISPYYLLDGMSCDTVVDNLNIRYSTFTLCTGQINETRSEGCVIQNCEVGWMGGGLFYYGGAEIGDDRTYLADGMINQNSGCVAGNGNGTIIRNNYVHHGYQEGISVETFRGDPPLENVLVSGNLVENCVQPIIVCNWDEEVDPDHIIRNCTVEDNYALHQGFEHWYYYEDEITGNAAFRLQGGPCGHDGTLSIRNNVFAHAQGSLVYIADYSEEYSKVFSGNTYITAPQMQVVREEGAETDDGTYTAENIAKTLGDDTATLARVPFDDLIMPALYGWY